MSEEKPANNDELEVDAKSPAAQFVGRNTLPLTLFVAFIIGCSVVVGLTASYSAMRVAPALLWSIAFGATGILLGFIFAIPRVPTTVPAAAPARTDGAGATSPASAPDDPPQPATGSTAVGSEVNSNLVEVSDWLTKIIVGVGLVEAKSLPVYAEGLAAFVAPSLGIATELAVPVVGGLMLYFSVLGFLSGYLLTRVYIAVLFKSVDVIIRNGLPPLRLESGRRIDPGKLALLQQSTIEDLQRTIASLPPEQLKTEGVLPTRTPSARQILWVDDHPDNNALLVDQLRQAGMRVEQVRTTAEALSRLDAGTVDVVISDMARDEGAGNIDDAGVVLTRAIHTRRPEIPVLIYCSAAMVRRHGTAAEEAGASLVTSSGTRLLAQLKRLIDSL